MPEKTLQITGRVLEAPTGKGFANLRVEAWDKDTRRKKPIDIVATDKEGGFQMELDASYLKPDDAGVIPEIAFKVYLGNRLIQESAVTPVVSARKKPEVSISVDKPAPRPPGKDHLNTIQAFKAVDFFRDSDLPGIVRNFRRKTGTSLDFLSDMVVNTVSRFDWTPVKVDVAREEEIVGKETRMVRERLQSNRIEVVDVQPYDPQLNAESIKNLMRLPAGLQEGQKVRLFEEEGKVRYYAVVKDDVPGTHAVGETGAQMPEIKKITEDLKQTKKLLDEKDREIAKLREELSGFRKEQEDVKRILTSEKFTKLMKDDNPGPVRRPTG